MSAWPKPQIVDAISFRYRYPGERVGLRQLTEGGSWWIVDTGVNAKQGVVLVDNYARFWGRFAVLIQPTLDDYFEQEMERLAAHA